MRRREGKKKRPERRSVLNTLTRDKEKKIREKTSSMGSPIQHVLEFASIKFGSNVGSIM
jgi:hypothetical protein